MALFAADFLTPTLGDAYHRFFPITSIYRAILLLTLLLWLAGSLAFWTLERLSLQWKRIFWLIPIVLLPWLFFRSMTVISFDSETSPVPLLMLRLGRWSAPAFGIVGLLLLVAAPKIYDRFVTGIRVCYMVAGFGLVVIIPRIGLHALRSGPTERPGFERAGLTDASPNAPRIVWILMDELSYDQVFASRQPDVQLPNFDRLAQTSVTFSDLQPTAAFPGPGSYTEYVLPSLMLGKVVVDLHKPYPGPPSYRSVAGGPWRRFSENDTIFAQAHALGWTTGVVGWYNPYCRLLAHVLDSCVWVYSEPVHSDLSGPLSTRKSIGENLLAMMPFQDRLNRLIHRTSNEPVQTHLDDYVSTMASTKRMIQDARIRFVFVHLPIPHPPGIYDRVHHVLRPGGTYMDNLVLADDSLASIREAIEATPAAANTTLIISSDHSWRPWVWKGLGEWSEAEDRATRGGKYDNRAVLIVHLPAETAPQVISKPVSVLIAHDIVDGLLRGEIQTPADLSGVIAQQPDPKIEAQTGN
jgi:Sulfatase